jgi:integrase
MASRSFSLAARRVKGIEARHARGCPAKGWDAEGVCTCEPAFQAQVWHAREQRLERRTFGRLRDAEHWRNEAAVAKAKGTLVAPNRKTLNELFDQFVAGAEDGTIRNKSRKPFKPSALRSYRKDIDARLRPRFGDIQLSALHRNDVQAYVDELIAGGLSPSRVRNILMPLRLVCRRAVRRGELGASPLTELDLPAVEGIRERIADPQEAFQLLDALPEQERALWATALFAGLRLGELRGLRVRDVDMRRGVISVRQAWDDVTGPIPPKSAAGIRDVPICRTLRSYLEVHMRELWDDGLLFGNAPDEPFGLRRVRSTAQRTWKSANLQRLTPHEARHSFRTFLDYAGVSEARADRYLGHSGGGVGRRYTHALEHGMRDDARLLETYLGGVRAGTLVQIAAVAS